MTKQSALSTAQHAKHWLKAYGLSLGGGISIISGLVITGAAAYQVKQQTILPAAAISLGIASVFWIVQDTVRLAAARKIWRNTIIRVDAGLTLAASIAFATAGGIQNKPIFIASGAISFLAGCCRFAVQKDAYQPIPQPVSKSIKRRAAHRIQCFFNQPPMQQSTQLLITASPLSLIGLFQQFPLPVFGTIVILKAAEYGATYFTDGYKIASQSKILSPN